MSRKAHMNIDKEQCLSPIDERIYGSFVEHVGREIYSGIYQPEHPSADEDGFRQDVLELVKELQVPIVRYPGGECCIQFLLGGFCGSKRAEKKRLELAWKALEPNEFGLNEFAKWCKKAGTEPMMAVNLGTRGIADALNLLEYCNMDTDSYYADLRRTTW